MGEGDSEQSKPFDFDSTINVQDSGAVLDASVLSSLGESLGDSSKEISNNLKDAATYSGDILKNVKAWATPTEKQEEGKEENRESKISDNIITRVADRSVASSKEEAGKVKQLSGNISTNIPSGNVITEEDVAVQTEDDLETLKQRAVGFSTAFVNVLSRSQFGRAMLNAFNSIVSWGTMLYKGFSLVMGGLNSMAKGVFNAVLHPIETIKSMWSGLLVGINAIGASIASAPVTWVLAIGGIVTSLLAYALNSFTDRESRVKYLEKSGYQVDNEGVVTSSSGKPLTEKDYENIQDKTILDNIKKVNDTYVLKDASELSWGSAIKIAFEEASDSIKRAGMRFAMSVVDYLADISWYDVITGNYADTNANISKLASQSYTGLSEDALKRNVLEGTDLGKAIKDSSTRNIDVGKDGFIYVGKFDEGIADWNRFIPFTKRKNPDTYIKFDKNGKQIAEIEYPVYYDAVIRQVEDRRRQKSHVTGKTDDTTNKSSETIKADSDKPKGDNKEPETKGRGDNGNTVVSSNNTLSDYIPMLNISGSMSSSVGVSINTISVTVG